MADGSKPSTTDPEKIAASAEPVDASPPQRSLEDLRTELETGKMEKEQRDKLLTEAMQSVMTQEARTALESIGEQDELTPEASQVLQQGTAYLLALADYRDREIGSVQDLITEYRVAKDEPSRFFAQALIHLLAQPKSAASQDYQLVIWEDAKVQSDEIAGAIDDIEARFIREEEAESKKKKEKKEEVTGEKDTWYERNKDMVHTALIGGALIGGVVLLTRFFFDKKDAGKAEGEKSSFWAKTGIATLLGAEVLGQAAGFEQVQKLISGGDPKHWIYSAGVRGLAAAADLELGTAMDFWTGNGPSEGEQTMFTEMAEIFDTSESRLWGTSKLNFDEFLGGKDGITLPWALDDNARIREQIKDYYLPQLEDKLPYLKNPRLRSQVTLKQVLVDGYKMGVIKELDTTDLKAKDRVAMTKREVATDQRLKESRKLFDHPEENIDELQETGTHMIETLGTLDRSTDQYMNDLLVAFENMIGVDFDLGEDDQGEYRDLKSAREILYSFFDEAGVVDHAFFIEKQDRVKAFKVFLEKHKVEKPWTGDTMKEFEEYKTEMLELQERIQASLQRAEMTNLKDMAEHRTGTEIIEDMSEFGVVGLSGAMHYLDFHLEKLGEGSATYWGITIAYGIAVGSQFADVDILKMRASARPTSGIGAVLWRLGPGAAIKAGVKTFETVKLAYNGTQLFRAFSENGEGILKKVLQGEMTETEARTRVELAKEFQDAYKTRWLRWTRNELTVARETIATYEDVGKNLDYLSEMESFFDGKIGFEKLNQPVREFLTRMKLTPTLAAEAIEEIRFTRAVQGMRSNPAFTEVLETMRGGSNPMSPQAQALFDSLNAEQKAAVTKLMSDGRGETILARLVTGTLAPDLPKYLSSAADGSSHTYRYGSVEYQVEQTELAQRAGDIDRARRASGEAPVAGQEPAWNDANRSRAIREACHERFTTAELMRPGVYRYAGVEFNVDSAEVTSHARSRRITPAEAAKELCIKQGVGHLTVEQVRPLSGGGYEYKIGGEWVSSSTPSTPDHVKTMFETEMAKQGRAFDFAKFASEAKALKFATALEKILGPVAAVAVIMHLEEAEDKRKAVCEVSAGFATFALGFKGAQLFDARVARYIKDPRARLVLDLCAGVAAAYGFTEPISDLMEHYFKSVPASHAVGGVLAGVFETASTRLLIRSTLRSMESGIIKKGAETIGMSGLTRAFETRVSAGFMKKIGAMAARNGFRQILSALGWRGVTTAALLADDATVIGVIDDVVAAGLAIWMIFDIVSIVSLVWNAAKVEEEMAERQRHKFTHVDIKDKASREAFQKALLPFGMTIEQGLNPTEEDKEAGKALTEEALFDILRTLPAVRLEMYRADTLGSEIWTLNNGEAVGIAILGESTGGQPGEVICEITDEDAAEMDEALTAMEEAEAKEAS